MKSVPSPEGVRRAPLAPSVPPLPKPLRRVKKRLSLPEKLASQARSIAAIVGNFRKLSDKVTFGLKATKFTKILSIPFVVYDAVDEAVKVVKKKPLKDKVRAAFTFITHINSIAESVSASCEILNAAKLVGERAIKWIPIFNIISFVTGFIAIGLSSESIAQSTGLLRSFHKTAKDLDSATNDVQRAKILITTLKNLETKGITPLRKKLMLSKKTQLEERIRTLATRLMKSRGKIQQKAIQESKHLMEILRSRTKMTLGFKATELANKVSGTASTAFTFTPIPLVGLIILATTGVSSLVTWGSRVMFVNKNPFDPESKSRAKALLDKASHSIASLRKKLQTFVIGAQHSHLKTARSHK